MKKISLLLVCIILVLSFSGCKSSRVCKISTIAQNDNSTDSSSEYSEILINTNLLTSISIHNAYDEELVKIPVKEDWGFLGEYTKSGTLPKEENHKLLAYPDTHIIHLNVITDEGKEELYEKVYLFNDGSIAKKEMCGDSGVTLRTYDIYKAEEKYTLTSEKLDALLKEYKKVY